MPNPAGVSPSPLPSAPCCCRARAVTGAPRRRAGRASSRPPRSPAARTASPRRRLPAPTWAETPREDAPVRRRLIRTVLPLVFCAVPLLVAALIASSLPVTARNFYLAHVTPLDLFILGLGSFLF